MKIFLRNALNYCYKGETTKYISWIKDVAREENMKIIGWIILAIGVGIVADGVGSILLPENKHGFWLDFERGLRIMAGLALVGIAVFA